LIDAMHAPIGQAADGVLDRTGRSMRRMRTLPPSGRPFPTDMRRRQWQRNCKSLQRVINHREAPKAHER
jgi:hypothetical protein